MTEYRAAFETIEDGLARFQLYAKAETPGAEWTEQGSFVRQPTVVDRDNLTPDDQFRPVFDDEDTIVDLEYDPELTQQIRADLDEQLRDALASRGVQADKNSEADL